MKQLIGILLFTIIGMPVFSTPGHAQINEDLYLYGYFQGIGRYAHQESNPHPEVERSLSFLIQQMNLFLFKQFDAEFSGFASLEITNSLSTENGWGSIAPEQAWMKYDLNQHLKIKAGLLIPTFNNLNTIKDRTPLLPYIMRPLAYETFIREFFNAGEFVPEQASIEVYGTMNLGSKTKLDYASYIGNNDGFIVSETVASLPTGSDSTMTKMLGGRVGIRHGDLKFGISTTFDDANVSNISLVAANFEGVGTVPRSRSGADLSFSRFNFFFESEFIRVFYGLSDSQKKQFRELMSSNPFLNNEFDKVFFYALLGLNLGENYFAYGMYSHFEDHTNIITEKGFGVYSVGGGYRPNDNLVFKIQFLYGSTYADSFLFGRETDILLGLSVFL